MVIRTQIKIPTQISEFEVNGKKHEEPISIIIFDAEVKDAPADFTNVMLSAAGGVLITFVDEDEFGNQTKGMIEITKQDIEALNKVIQ